MGHWYLEIFKLSLYVAFPVSMFYVYNQASIFEDWVIETKRQMLPPDSQEQSELKNFIKQVRDEQEAKLLLQMKEEASK